MSRYPLSELAASPEVRQAKKFRKAAAGMTGQQLAQSYATQQESGGGGLVEPVLTAARAPKGEAEKLAADLVERCRKGQTIALPGDQQVDLRARAVAGNDADAPRIDLVGVDGEGRLVVVAHRYSAPDATRCAVGDTPLRLLIEGLAACALADGEKPALQAALAADGREIAEDAPILLIVASKRYWELCRKRESQAGAAWIHEVERLAREIETQIGVTVHCLTLESGEEVEGAEAEAADALELVPAWEPNAGTVKVRAKSSARSAPAEVVIEADPSKPTRPYASSEQYEPGDQIDHRTLGTGVVQRVLGATKVEVLFDGTRRLLVQGRPAPGP